jgi:GNAT superfamily N-acetyltransferase
VLKLRSALPADAAVACEVFNAHDPDEPQDPVVTRHRWGVGSPDFLRERFLLERADGRAVGFAFRGHKWWARPDARFASNDVRVIPEARDPGHVNEVFERLESANVEEGAQTLLSRTREGFQWEIEVLESRGYRYDRLSKAWELDLVARRRELLAARGATREEMARQGIELLTEAAAADPEMLRKLHQLNEETTQDIPTTEPHFAVSLAEFEQWGASPDIRADRSWVARDGEQVVAWSYLKYPAVGRVWTGYTCCARSHRGRGIARAVKMETLGQAIDLGVSSVRTDNDDQNAPMLHINEKLGYDRVPGFVTYLKEVR